jgi:hypothetical protein
MGKQETETAQAGQTDRHIPGNTANTSQKQRDMPRYTQWEAD